MKKGYKETMPKRSHDNEGNPIYGAPTLDTGEPVIPSASEHEIDDFILEFRKVKESIYLFNHHMTSGKYINAKAEGMKARKAIDKLETILVEY